MSLLCAEDLASAIEQLTSFLLGSSRSFSDLLHMDKVCSKIFLDRGLRTLDTSVSGRTDLYCGGFPVENFKAMQMIEDIELFEGLAGPTVETLRQQIRARKLTKAELLFNAGDASDSMYLVQKGRIRIWTVSAAGAEVTLNVLGPGTVFGEIGLLDGSERTAGASALDAVELLTISRGAFDNALDRDPQLARNVISFLCERLRWVSARMEDSALRSAPERLARMLVHLVHDYGVETSDGMQLSINLTQGELARWTHMSRESLNKILNRWSDEGMLIQSRGKITVKDQERLEEISEFGEDE